jgi:hypothetical protein
MTDDDAPAVTAAELRAMLERAPLEAAARGLRVLPATVKDAEVLFIAPEVSLDDALDVAAGVGAPFVTIRDLPFDAAMFLEDANEVPGSIRTAASSHDGDLAGIDVRFFGAGVAYAWWARSAWSRDLERELETWQEDEGERQEREDRERRARTGELIGAVVADPGIRGAKPASRKALIEGFIRARVDPDEDVAAGFAIVFAPKRVSDEWREAYALLDQTAVIFIRDLRESEDWQRTKWNTSARRDVLRQFAISRTGGWAPTEVWVKEMDRRSAPTK